MTLVEYFGILENLIRKQHNIAENTVTKWQIQLPIKYDEHKKDYRIIKHFTIQGE